MAAMLKPGNIFWSSLEAHRDVIMGYALYKNRILLLFWRVQQWIWTAGRLKPHFDREWDKSCSLSDSLWLNRVQCILQMHKLENMDLYVFMKWVGNRHHRYLLKSAYSLLWGITDFQAAFLEHPPHLNQPYCFLSSPYLSMKSSFPWNLPFPLMPSTSRSHALFTSSQSSLLNTSISIHFSLPLPPQFLPAPIFPQAHLCSFYRTVSHHKSSISVLWASLHFWQLVNALCVQVCAQIVFSNEEMFILETCLYLSFVPLELKPDPTFHSRVTLILVPSTVQKKISVRTWPRCWNASGRRVTSPTSDTASIRTLIQNTSEPS